MVRLTPVEVKVSSVFGQEVKAEFTFSADQHNALEALWALAKQDPEKLDIVIKKKSKRKSNSAMNMLWKLCNEIARVIQATPEEVYRELICDYGISEVVEIPRNEKWRCEEHDRRGKGYCHEILEEDEAVTTVILYYGASGYDTVAMARLLNGAVYEAEELGIDTRSVEELLEAWNV